MVDAKLNKVVGYRRKIDELQQQLSRAEGALEQTLTRLKPEFGFSSIEKAKKSLRILTKRNRQRQKDFEKAQAAFEKKWKEYL